MYVQSTHIWVLIHSNTPSCQQNSGTDIATAEFLLPEVKLFWRWVADYRQSSATWFRIILLYFNTLSMQPKARNNLLLPSPMPHSPHRPPCCFCFCSSLQYSNRSITPKKNRGWKSHEWLIINWLVPIFILFYVYGSSKQNIIDLHYLVFMFHSSLCFFFGCYRYTENTLAVKYSEENLWTVVCFISLVQRGQ